MIKVYACNFKTAKERGFIIDNEAYFLLYFFRRVEVDDIAKGIIESIEGTPYIGNNRFMSKFEKGVDVPIKELSTSSKTALNAYAFPDKVFFVGECGSNAIEEIFKLKDASIFFDEVIPSYSFNFECDIEYHEIGETREVYKHFTNTSDLFDYDPYE